MNIEIERLLPVRFSPTSVSKLELSYRRDYDNHSETRVIAKAGGERLIIEDYVLRYYCENGYDGLFGQNEIWSLLGSFLFFEDLLTTYGSGPEPLYSLLSVKYLPEKMDETTYLEKLKYLKDNPILTDYIHKKEEEYSKLTLYFKMEKERRSSERYIGFLNWIGILINNIERNVLLRIIDFVIRSPGSSVIGMPDLVLCRNGDISFVEVKSQADKLSKAQSFALNHLSSTLGFNVCLAECKEIIDESNIREKEIFDQRGEDAAREREELKTEIESMLGCKIQAGKSFHQLNIEGTFSFQVYAKIIEGLFDLNYRWISISLYKGSPYRIDWINTEGFPSQELRTLGKKISLSDEIVETTLAKCEENRKKVIDLHMRRSLEKELVDSYLQAREMENNDPEEAIEIYSRICNAHKEHDFLLDRIRSYITGSLARKSLILERLQKHADCLAAIDEYLSLAEGLSGPGSPTKDDLDTISKRRTRVSKRIGG
ncbi:MAG: VRR-NUC domain-containing protein [Candidatus Thermoplasmatota archaeon]|nr:VRR-NUC domain-containing protein [Candidatus Thermoplasmatota archaeon]